MRKLLACQRAALLAALLLLAACASTASSIPAPATLAGDFGVHDPTMIRQGDFYYVFSTGDERYNYGTVQIRRSKDLVTWERIGSVFERAPDWITEQLGKAPPNLWAPDISFANGTYSLYYAGSSFGSNNSVIGLATNTTLDPASPDYKWVDQGMVIRSRASNNWNAIDPNLVRDQQNAAWLALGSFWDGIKMVRIDPATGKSSTDDTKIYPLASRGGGAIEAPAIIFHNGYYYLFVSFDSCCRGVLSTYKIMVGRSQQITGPYLDKAGTDMLGGGGSLLLEGAGEYVGPGGQFVFDDNGTIRMVNHYYSRTENGAPKLQIHDLQWDADGWPKLAGA